MLDLVDSQTSTQSATDRRVARARAMIGVQYKRLGRDRHGIDCLGLMLHVYERQDTEIDACLEAMSMLEGYYGSRAWNKDTAAQAYLECSRLLVAGLTNHLHLSTLEDVQIGDVLIFSFKSRDRAPDHAGIYVGKGKVVHADMKRGVIEHSLEGRLERRLVGVFTPEV